MVHYNSADEIKQRHLESLGPELGPVYHALLNEVVWIHAKWQEYRKLYAHSEERIDLLNTSAGHFFRIIQDALWENVLLHIARLTDPPKQQRFENLTLRRLPDAISDAGLAAELRSLVGIALDQSNFAREWRNKLLAHHDLLVAVEDRASRLQGASRSQVEKALASFRAIMNRLHIKYFDSEVAFEHFLTHDDANGLIHHLAIAARYEERRRERFLQGMPTAEDLEPPPTV